MTIHRTTSETDFSPLIYFVVFAISCVSGLYWHSALFFFFPILTVLCLGGMFIIFRGLAVVWPRGFPSLTAVVTLVTFFAFIVGGLYIAFAHWSGPTPNVRAYFTGYTYSAESAPSAALTQALALPANRPLRRISKIAVGRLYLRLRLRDGREATFIRQAAHHPNGWCCTSGHWYASPAGQYKAPLRFLARCTRAAVCSVHVAPSALRHPFTAADVTAMITAMRTGLSWVDALPLKHTRQRASLATWWTVAPGRTSLNHT
jgi:hypothetical protein